MFWDKHPQNIRPIQESLQTVLLANHPAAASHTGTDTQGSTSHASFPPRPMFVLPFFLPLFSISEQSGKREEHPKYSSPGSQQPLTPFPDECEHSSCRNPHSIPLQRPSNLPSVLPCMLLIFLTSTAATQPQSSAHCQSVNDCRKPLLAAPLPLPPLGAGPGA